MAREDRFMDDLRGIFDNARKTSGHVQAEALLAAAPFVLHPASPGQQPEIAFMRDRLTRESYQSICRGIGDELDRLNAEISRLKRLEVIASVVQDTQRRIVARPPSELLKSRPATVRPGPAE